MPATAKKPRKKPVNLTPRAKKDLVDMGFTVQTVERFNTWVNKRLDLYGCIDILAHKPGFGILGVQVTSGSNHAARRTKAMNEPRLRTWLESGGKFQIWSYSKNNSNRWILRSEAILLNGDQLRLAPSALTSRCPAMGE